MKMNEENEEAKSLDRHEKNARIETVSGPVPVLKVRQVVLVAVLAAAAAVCFLFFVFFCFHSRQLNERHA